MRNKRILILEDEQRAGDKLLDLLKTLDPDAEIFWKRSVQDGIDFLSKNTDLDLIISDIELIDGKAFSIYDTVAPTCPIIFCTAYDRFYVNAFKTNGIAYLLKPYTSDQFKEVWEKYILLFDQKEKESVDDQSGLMVALQELMQGQNRNFKKTFTVKKRDGVFLLKTNDIAYFQAQGDFVLAFDFKNKKHVINQSLSSIEEVIDPSHFFQINRSEIVQLEAIEKYAPYTKSRLVISLKNTDTELFTSNSRSSEFRAWLEGQ